jgi:hypothetical protein
MWDLRHLSFNLCVFVWWSLHNVTRCSSYCIRLWFAFLFLHRKKTRLTVSELHENKFSLIISLSHALTPIQDRSREGSQGSVDACSSKRYWHPLEDKQSRRSNEQTERNTHPGNLSYYIQMVRLRWFQLWLCTQFGSGDLSICRCGNEASYNSMPIRLLRHQNLLKTSNMLA